MNTNNQQTYSGVSDMANMTHDFCKEYREECRRYMEAQFNNINEKIDTNHTDIMKYIRGNGQPGLNDRVIRLEEQVKVNTGIRQWIMNKGIAIVVSMIALIVAAWGKLP
jgi:hypothetical protein